MSCLYLMASRNKWADGAPVPELDRILSTFKQSKWWIGNLKGIVVGMKGLVKIAEDPNKNDWYKKRGSNKLKAGIYCTFQVTQILGDGWIQIEIIDNFFQMGKIVDKNSLIELLGVNFYKAQKPGYLDCALYEKVKNFGIELNSDLITDFRIKIQTVNETAISRLSESEVIQPEKMLPEGHTPRAIDIDEDITQPERVLQETYRILRDTTLARKVKESHQYRCQICGKTFKLGKTPYAEAHHIMPLGRPHNGPDVRGNILCVCPNDHVLLDYGAIKLDVNHLEGNDKEFINYHNNNIYEKALV